MIARGQLTGRHVLMAFIGFFGVVFAVNGVFVYFATSSWTGLETENAYIRGLAYNRVLDAAATQRALGWDVRVEVASEGLGTTRVLATFTDASGIPLGGLLVAAEFRRPATENFDQAFTLNIVGAGEYGAAIDLPLAGNWDLRVVARRDEAEQYIVERRVWVE